MKVLVVGKQGSVAYWMENTMEAFRREGHETSGFSVTGAGFLGRLQVRLTKRTNKAAVPAVVARQFARTMHAVRPDLVVFTHAFWGVPLEVYQAAHELDFRPPMIGWAGDRFDAAQRAKAELLDHVFFTDSGFFADARAYGFPERYSYLALAADPVLFHPGTGERINDMLFVANQTPHREDVVRAVRTPMHIYGRSWEGIRDGIHKVHSHRISMQRVADLYGRHLAVLNVLNELNLIQGLNQRNFEPLAAGAVVISEQVQDMELCFEPGREILIYRDMDELNELYDRIRADTAFARSIAEAGYRRVLSEHTYEHRVRSILKLVDA